VDEENIEERRKADAYALAMLIYDIWREKKDNLGKEAVAEDDMS
jgi:hypothetical protein